MLKQKKFEIFNENFVALNDHKIQNSFSIPPQKEEKFKALKEMKARNPKTTIRKFSIHLRNQMTNNFFH